jgi:hypothetical protein
MLAPPWIPIPPPRYGGIETVIAMLTDKLVDLRNLPENDRPGTTWYWVVLPAAAPPAHPASTQQIRELRDQGLTGRDSGAGRYDGLRCLEPLQEGPAAQVPALGLLAAGVRRRT